MTGVLQKAVSAGRPRQVRLLLDSGISIEARDDCGQTALIRAVFIEHHRSRQKIVRMLLRYGSIVSKTDLVGRNALSWGCLYGRDKEVKLLMEFADINLDVNQTDIYGQTALFHGATSGNAATVKLIVDELLKYGLSVDVANQAGVTPLMQAIKLGHDVCASILVRQGGATVGLPAGGRLDGICPIYDWLTQYHKPLSKARPYQDECNKTQLPPILNQSLAKKIKYREIKAAEQNIHRDCLYDYAEHPSYGSELSSVRGSVDLLSGYTQMALNMTRLDPGIPHSIRTMSKTSSTEMIADSSDDDVDDFSTPVKEKLFQPSKDLHHMYRIFEEQNSGSYRPGAARPKNSSADSGLDTTEPGSSDSNGEGRRQTLAKKLVTLRKAVPRLESLVKMEASTDGGNRPSSSESDTEKNVFHPAQKTFLPKIGNRRSACLQLQLNKGEQEKLPPNYSCN